MKKRLCILILSIICSFAFSNGFIRDRFFEVKVNTPVNFVNNTFHCFDLFQKELVIDLRELADRVPDTGALFCINANPNIEINLNIKDKIRFSYNYGMDLIGNVTLHKNLFTLLGYGNEESGEVEVSGTCAFDAFMFYSFEVATNINKFAFSLKPNLFFPIFGYKVNDLSLQLKNNEEGTLVFEQVYTQEVYFSQEELYYLFTPVMNCAGVDIEGAVEFKPFDLLTFNLNFKVPILPGKYKYCAKENISVTKEINIFPNDESEESDEDLSQTEENFDQETEDNASKMDMEEINILIRRPLKANLQVDFMLLKNFLVLSAAGGVGISNPFFENYLVYPEYYFGIEMNFGNILRTSLSTEYINQIFSHNVKATINLRLIQVDAGFSFSGLEFFKTFRGNGFGAFVSVAMGF